MIALKTILVATDFSEPSDCALAYGRELASTFGATLHVLHVAEDLSARAAGEAYPMVLPEMQREVEDAAWKQLESTVTSEDRKTLHAICAVRTSASPAVTIVEYAVNTGADLIVVGTHGRGTLARLVLGSVAERVVRTARCPVLTVRAEERDFVAPDAAVLVRKATA